MSRDGFDFRETRNEHRTRQLKDMLAVDAAKLTAAGSHIVGKQGTSLPGKAALAASSTILEDLAGQVRKKIFAVCGTNGKTTTNNILCAMLEDRGHKVVCNRLGANMLYGVTGAFTASADLSGSLDADYACIEVDEASAVKVFGRIRPSYLILTNLFRDQLDRYGEIDITIDLLLKAIRLVPDMKLIVNADDPLSVYLAEASGNPFVTYGIDESPGKNRESGEIREGRFCKWCGGALQYDYYQYGQMGNYYCTSCHFRRPVPDYAATGISQEDGLSFSVNETRIRTQLRGLYHVYNLLAVWSALRENADDCARFEQVLQEYVPQFGRSESFQIGGARVLLNLAKNPAGFNQNIDAMLEDKQPKDLIIAINDQAQDGIDVSWLWDVDFQKIRDASVRSVTVSGIRGLDMQLRLKYDEIFSQVAASPEEAVDTVLERGSDNLYVLVNYTALFAVHRFLQKKENTQKNSSQKKNNSQKKDSSRQ